MSLGIRVSVSLPRKDRPRSPTVQALAESIMYEALTRARDRIAVKWPVDTGRSQAAWAVVQTGPLSYVLLNQARDRYGMYAGYVHRKGNKTPLAETLVPFEVERARREIREDLQSQASGRAVPRRGTMADALRAKVRRAILATIARRGLERALQRVRAARAAQAA